jgi:hypothetical protein
MTISALPLLSSATAAPLSLFALPLAFTCSQTQWLHVKVRGGASEDSVAEKSALNAITNFCTLLTAATALPPTMQQRLLQHCLASRPYSNVYWDGCLSFVAADAAGVMKPSHFVSQIFTIEKK